MSELIKLGCTIADGYHRYHEIHGTLLGASILRRMVDTLRGKRERTSSQFSQRLNEYCQLGLRPGRRGA